MRPAGSLLWRSTNCAGCTPPASRRRLFSAGGSDLWRLCEDGSRSSQDIYTQVTRGSAVYHDTLPSLLAPSVTRFFHTAYAALFPGNSAANGDPETNEQACQASATGTCTNNAAGASLSAPSCSEQSWKLGTASLDKETGGCSALEQNSRLRNVNEVRDIEGKEGSVSGCRPSNWSSAATASGVGAPGERFGLKLKSPPTKEPGGDDGKWTVKQNVRELFDEFERALPAAMLQNNPRLQERLQRLRHSMDEVAVRLVRKPDSESDLAAQERLAGRVDKMYRNFAMQTDEQRRLQLARAIKEGSVTASELRVSEPRPQPEVVPQVSVHLNAFPKMRKLKPAGATLADDFFCRQNCEFITSTADGKTLNIPRGMPTRLPTVAFLGRSNCGKSSLINSLLNKKRLARISGTPGFTKTVNLFAMGNVAFLVDMPGYGERSQSEWGKCVMTYLTNNRNLRQCYLLVDADVGISGCDIDMLNILEGANLPYQVVLTKVDKCKPRQLNYARRRMYETLFLRQFPESQPEHLEHVTQEEADRYLPPVFNVSSHHRVGISDLRFDVLVQCGVASEERAYEDEASCVPA